MTVENPVRCMSGEIPEDNGFDVKEVLIAAMKDNRPLQRARPARYKPSGLMDCKRKVYYDRIGALQKKDHHDMDNIGWTEAGNAIHDRLQMLLGSKLGDSVHIEGMVEGVEWPSKGYIDAEAEDWIIEFKGIGSSSFSALSKPKEEHIWQAHMYMWLRDIPRAQILYINRDTWAMKNFKIGFDETVFRRMMEVIGYIEDCVKKDEPPKKINRKWVCGRCEYAHVCKPEV